MEEQKPNQCLGMNNGKRCKERLPRGKHLCNNCQRKINSLKVVGSRSKVGPFRKDLPF